MNIALFLEIKNEYTEHLVDTITPYIYEGIMSIYREAESISRKHNCHEKLLLIFQKLLQSIDDWNQSRIDQETFRIKQSSRTSDYLDDLLRAVVKSYIILLTHSNVVSGSFGEKFLDTIELSRYIHLCYIECGKYAHNNPYLYYTDPDHPMEQKRNLIIIQTKVREGTMRAIRKLLPVGLIVKEYLANTINIFDNQGDANIELVESCKKQASSKKHELSKKHESSKNSHKYSHKVSTGKSSDKNKHGISGIIKTESSKSCNDKIRAIMNMDKLLSSYVSEANHNPSLLNKSDVNLEYFDNMAYVSDIDKIHNKSDTVSRIMDLAIDTVTNETRTNKSMKNKGLETSEQVPLSQAIFIENYG